MLRCLQYNYIRGELKNTSTQQNYIFFFYGLSPPPLSVCHSVERNDMRTQKRKTTHCEPLSTKSDTRAHAHAHVHTHTHTHSDHLLSTLKKLHS